MTLRAAAWRQRGLIVAWGPGSRWRSVEGPGSGSTRRVTPAVRPGRDVGSAEARTRLGIVYAADPVDPLPGGIETVIRGIIEWAPEDIEVSVLGLTTDRERRPVGCWTECRLNRNSYRHYAAYAVSDKTRQPRIPAVVKLMTRLALRLRSLRGRFDVLEFHRIEPVAVFAADPTPKTAVFHQNMAVLESGSSDIRWKYLPGVYHRLEAALIARLDSVFVVREDAVEDYRRRYPALADRFRFTPTWMDPDRCHPVSPDRRAALRERLLGPHGIDDTHRVLVTVGRLDHQKDPLLLLESFAAVAGENANARLVIVGDGVLRAEVEAAIERHGLGGKVVLTGLARPEEVAAYLQAADLFVLSSAYEGMPISVLEALGCGIPVCTTDVGEVGRAVLPGRNGEIVTERTPAGLARGMALCLDRLDAYAGEPCIRAVEPFVPARVLEPLYENYRRLAHAGSR